MRDVLIMFSCMCVEFHIFHLNFVKICSLLNRTSRTYCAHNELLKFFQTHNFRVL